MAYTGYYYPFAPTGTAGQSFIVGSNGIPVFTSIRSEVFVDTGNGCGSTATKVRRFSNIRKNTGTAITYADSAVNGGTFTIAEDGIYSITYGDANAAGSYIAITVDVSSVTTSPNGLTYANGRRHGTNLATGGIVSATSWTGFIAAASVVRAQNAGGNADGDGFCSFSITQVSK